ncbi:MAG: RluA family pseudouridine synthase [Saprospiraceae bacterium]|nr:RluA family pseudouridine synthase [Saprospiraceae bacterium]
MRRTGNSVVSILYQDDDMVIVNKPARLLSIPDRFKPDLPNLQHILREQFQAIYTVHRLDRDTSGIMCFAKNEQAHKHLSEQFESRTIKKTYLAFTEGYPPEESGLIDQPIAANPGKPGRMMVHSKGKPSQTGYTVKERFKHHAILEIQLHTGRTHQIRVHLAYIGSPLLVDPVYGKRDSFFLSSIKGKKYHQGKSKEERPLVTRLTLHASELWCIHPSTQEKMHWKAEMPKDLSALQRQFSKWITL